MLLFGSIYVASGVLLLLRLDSVSTILWPAGCLVAMFLISLFYSRAARRSGISAAPPRTELVAVSGFAACMAAAILSGSVLVPMAVIAVGYLALGWLYHNPLSTIATLVGLCAAATLSVNHVQDGLQELAFGTPFLLGGLVLRRNDGANR